MTNDIHAMIPPARKAALGFIAELRDKKIGHKVTSTLRTQLEQFALWLQGRTSLQIVNTARLMAGMFPISEKENTYTVTNCDGVTVMSRHQVGDAMDVALVGPNGNPVWPSSDDPRWGIMGAIGEKHGFRWGGRWLHPDPAHYEFVG